MKHTHLVILAFSAQLVHAQEIKHESNGDGLKLSLDVPGATGSATAGGDAADASSSIPSGRTSPNPEKPGIPQLPSADYIRSTPEPGTSGGSRESMVFLEHNGKSVKVMRRQNHTGADEVVVTTKSGGKEKVEVMSPAEYEQKYLRPKAGKHKPAAQESPAEANRKKDATDKKKGGDAPDGQSTTSGASTIQKVEKTIQTEIDATTRAGTDREDKRSEESPNSAPAVPGGAGTRPTETPAAPQKANRATE